MKRKLDQVPKHWDRLFAPSSCLAMITTVDAQGRPNAASYGTCTRVHHAPVYIAFTTTIGKDTANNVFATGEFTVNLPRWERDVLEKVRICGLSFPPGVNELEKAGLTSLPGRVLRPKALAMRATSAPMAPSPRMPSVLPVSGCGTVCTHFAFFWFATATAYGFAT